MPRLGILTRVSVHPQIEATHGMAAWPTIVTLDDKKRHSLRGQDQSPQDTVLVPTNMGQRRTERRTTRSHVLVRDCEVPTSSSMMWFPGWSGIANVFESSTRDDRDASRLRIPIRDARPAFRAARARHPVGAG